MKQIAAILLCLTTLQLFAQTTPENNKYLLVLDVQNHFTSTIFPEEKERTGFIDTVNSVIEKINPENVIYVESLAAQLVLTLNSLSVNFPYDLHMDERLKMVNQNYIIKKRSDVFLEKDMIDFAQENKATEFIVIGLAADHCVLKSLLGGQKLGYHMTIIPEAVAGTTPEKKQEALIKIREAGISIVHIKDFL